MRRQRGVALITALVLVALATVLAVSIGFDSAMAARRSTATLGMEQGLQLAQGAEAGAALVLGTLDGNKNIDSLDESWARPFPAVEVVPEVGLEAQLFDEQGKFNLNTLVYNNGEPNEDAIAVFKRLLELLQIQGNWADLLVDWLDPNTSPLPEGGEDNLYLSQANPGRAGNVAITSVSELEQIPGFGHANYLLLKPYVTALPPNVTTINTCTAKGPLLDAIFALSTQQKNKVEFSKLSDADLMKLRQRECFPRADDFARGEPPALRSVVSERSSYFQLHTWVRIGPARFTLYSLMYRQGDKVRPIARTFGTE